MKLSVIMSNYNGAHYIKEAIDSVIGQDYQPFEFLVIDDGSTDNSRDVIDAACDRYADRVRTHYVSRNQGQGPCLNYGINQIDGEAVCFIDSDDLWLPGKLQSVAKAFSDKPDAVIYQHNLLLMKNGQITNQKFRDILVEGNYYEHSISSRLLPQFVPTTGLSIKVDCLKKILPIPDVFRVCADGYITRTSMCWGEVTSSYEAFGVYRVHESNNTYGNNKFDEKKYLNNLLYPALNKYYVDHELELRYGNVTLLQKILDTSLKKILREYLGMSV